MPTSITSPRSRVAGLTALAVLALSACSDSGDGTAERATPGTGPTPSPTSVPSPGATPSPTPTEASVPGPTDVDGDAAFETVEHLSEDIGNRHATSEAYAEAADWVEAQLSDLGYAVTRQGVDVPAGNTWGVDVPAGEADNVIADPPGLDTSEPYAVVGAHLDTIPAAPGAEDNASGVAVMLELARLARLQETEVPVRFVAFGAEEPRGPGDDLHHFGSQEYVAQMSDAERDALVGMVALDRVGVRGPAVPICNGGDDAGVRAALADAAESSDTEHTVCGDNRTSDHWSFERNGLPGARLGSIPYAGYHSPGDVADVVARNQLVRTGRIAWTWMQDLTA